MPAMILCAGLGTRLRPLSSWLPKALAPVGDRPVLIHALERLRGVPGPVVVNAYHLAPALRRFLGEHADMAVRSVKLLEEASLLGTAGGLANARTALGEGDVLVWSGDIVGPIDGVALLAAHGARSAPGVAATLALVPGEAGSGNVGIDAAGTVVRLRAETVRGGEVQGGLFTAVHVVGAELRRTLPAEGCLVSDVYLPALRRGATLGVFEVEGFCEIGSLDTYLATNLAWLAGRGGGSWTAPGATVGPSVQLEACVIGEGAEVVGEGLLARCVVWPGARAVAPLADAVVARQGVARSR